MPQKKSKITSPNPLPDIPRDIPPAMPPQKENNDEESIETVPLYKNVKVVIPLFLVVLALSIFAWNYYIQLRDYVSTDDAYIDADRVSVSAKILGRIDQLAADEGDSVRQGQILVRLDDSDLRAQETQAKSSLAFAHENILLAKVNLEKAETDFKRVSTQFHQSIIPKEQYDNAQSELASSRARLNISNAQAVSAQAQLGVIQTQLKNTIIASPMTGVISKRWVLTGDVVQPGQSVYTIYNVKDVWVTANLEETGLGALRLGDTVDISVDTYPHVKFGGTIIRLGSNTASQFSLIPPNNASGNFTKVTQRVPIKMSIERFSGTHPTQVKLLPGMSVEVKVKVH
jgi:membrane fusion protein, multidrug efflux system